MRAVVRWSAVAVLAVVGTVAVGFGADYAPSSSQPVLEIWKGQRLMELRQGQQVLRQFKVALGASPRFAKEAQGDFRTPVGHYYISEKHVSRFHRFLALSYPNVDDAERGYTHGMIDANQWADIFFANLRRDSPTPATRLGGRVGIHGFGNRPYMPFDWTEGCIAVRNEEIEYLYDVLPVGTEVVINE